jgi:hypothetical protein
VPAGAPAKSSRLPLLVIGGVLLVALVIGGALRLTQGSSGDDSGSLPSPEDLPNDTVAVISGAPASLETVTQPDFQRALIQAAAQAKVEPVPGPGDKKYDELRETALGEILDSIWIQGQAEEMGVSVTPGEISAELKKLKKQSFKTEKQYEEFLEEAHFTPTDVDERVTIQVLSQEIQDMISRRGGSSEHEQQKVFADFVKRYEARWRSRTVCAPAFAIERCSNGEKAEAPQGGDSAAPPGEIPGAG